MAQYNISASGNQLIIELIVTDGDFAPSIVSLKTPSIKLTTDRIKFFDSAVYNMALLFEQINEIDGVAPTDLEDAADKIIALIANFNGGGAAPYKVYTALLTQTGTNAPVATVLENTLGGEVIFSYVSPGDFEFQPPFTLDVSKTFIIMGSVTGQSDLLMYSLDDLGNLGYVSTFTNAVLTNGLLRNTPIKIEVYN